MTAFKAHAGNGDISASKREKPEDFSLDVFYFREDVSISPTSEEARSC